MVFFLFFIKWQVLDPVLSRIVGAILINMNTGFKNALSFNNIMPANVLLVHSLYYFQFIGTEREVDCYYT